MAKQKADYEFMVSYSSVAGGTNNLCTAYIVDDRLRTLAVGQSRDGQEKAKQNARRNAKKAGIFPAN